MLCTKCRRLENHIADTDIVGRQYQGFEVLEYVGQDKFRNHLYNLQCMQCGMQTTASYTRIVSGKLSHCVNCDNPRYQDISNKRFGLLTAVKPLYTNKNNQRVWQCICDCDKVVQYTVNELNQKVKLSAIVSCGCKSRLFGTSYWELNLCQLIADRLGNRFKCTYATKDNINTRKSQFTLYYKDEAGKRHRYQYDMCIEDTLTNRKYIVECNGLGWHVKDGIDKRHPLAKSKMTAEQIVAYDQRKVDYAVSKGYTVIVVYDDVSVQLNVEYIIKQLELTT